MKGDLQVTRRLTLGAMDALYDSPMIADPGESIRARVASAKMTAADHKIAGIVIGKFPDSALLSEGDIATQAGVSAASVTRFAVKLGYKNFNRLQEALRAEMRARLTSPYQRLDITNPRRSAPAPDFLVAAINTDIENLRRTLDGIDSTVFASLVNHLATSSGHLFIAGSKKGFVPALYFGMQMQQIREKVSILDLGEHLMDDLLDVKPSATLVVFEPRRATRRLITVVNQFKGAAATVAVISDEFPPAPLATVDYLITASTSGISIFDSYSSLISVANALLAAVVDRNRNRVRERIERLESINRNFEMWFDAAPAPSSEDSRKPSDGKDA